MFDLALSAVVVVVALALSKGALSDLALFVEVLLDVAFSAVVLSGLDVVLFFVFFFNLVVRLFEVSLLSLLSEEDEYDDDEEAEEEELLLEYELLLPSLSLLSESEDEAEDELLDLCRRE